MPGTKSPILADFENSQGQSNCSNFRKRSFQNICHFAYIFNLRPWKKSIAYVTSAERKGAGYGKLEVDHG